MQSIKQQAAWESWKGSLIEETIFLVGVTG